MSGGVVTVTAAGAIDATYRVQRLERGAFTRASAYERELSGKGVNVAAALRHTGRAVTAVVALGRDDLPFAEASPLAGMLRIVAVPGATRVNTSIIDEGGATTKVNAPIPPMGTEGWAAVRSAVAAACAELTAGWLVVSGALPSRPGSSDPVDLGGILRDARAAGVRVALDTSGAGLARAIETPAGIALLKPNTHELAELTRRPLQTIGDVAAAARDLIEAGVGAVYTSMGADGALVVSAAGVVHAHAVARDVVNTAGAGDASLAGFLAGLGNHDPAGPEALARAAATAAAWGAHAVAQATTVLARADDAPRADVTSDPDPTTRLTDPAA